MWLALANKTIQVEGTVKQVPLRPLGFEWARHVPGQPGNRCGWSKAGEVGQIGGFAGGCEGLWLLLNETGATSGIWTKDSLIEGECRHSLGMAEEKPSNWIFIDDFLGFQVILPCAQIERHCFREARGPINRREPAILILNFIFIAFLMKPTSDSWQLTLGHPASPYTGPLEGLSGGRAGTSDAYWLL